MILEGYASQVEIVYFLLCTSLTKREVSGKESTSPTKSLGLEKQREKKTCSVTFRNSPVDLKSTIVQVVEVLDSCGNRP